MDLDKLKKLQNNVKEEQKINDEKLEAQIKEKIKELVNAINSDDFDTWLSNTLEEILNEGISPYIGWGFEFAMEGENAKEISYLVVSNKNHRFHPVSIDININKRDEEKYKHIFSSIVDDITEALLDNIYDAGLSCDVDGLKIDQLGENGIKMLVKVFVDD